MDIKIISIQNTHDVACRFANALVNGVIYAFVRFTYKCANAISVSLHYVDGAIGAHPIDNNMFDISMPLRQDRLNGILMVALLFLTGVMMENFINPDQYRAGNLWTGTSLSPM